MLMILLILKMQNYTSNIGLQHGIVKELRFIVILLHNRPHNVKLCNNSFPNAMNIFLFPLLSPVLQFVLLILFFYVMLRINMTFRASGIYHSHTMYFVLKPKCNFYLSANLRREKKRNMAMSCFLRFCSGPVKHIKVSL